MIRQTSKVFFALAALALLPLSVSHAQVTLDIEDVVTPAGAAVSVGIVASGPTTGLLGADIPLDFGGDGLGLPTGLTFDSFSTPFALPTLGGGPPSEDAFVGGANIDGTSVTLPSEIITLNFTVASDVAPGTVFDIEFLDPTFSGLNSISVTDTSFTSFAPTTINGSITIEGAAVPEPSSFVLVAFGLGGLALRRRRC